MKVSFSISWLTTLVVVLGIGGLAVTVPFAFLPYITPTSSLFLLPAFTLIGFLVVPLASVAHVRDKNDDTRVLMPLGYDVLLFVGGLLVTALAAGALVNTGMSLRSCTDTRSEQAVSNFIFNETCAQLNETITAGSLPLYRRPNFAFNLLWFQACRDELPIVIYLMAAYGVLVGAGITTAIGAFGRRNDALSRPRSL